jgi:D-ribulokinase
MSGELALGIDVGTSGIRVAAVHPDGQVEASVAVAMPAPRAAGGAMTADPETWWQATCVALHAIAGQIELARVRALAVDGTSGTIIGIDAAGRPVTPARMYNDACAAATAQRIAAVAPSDSAARGATSALGRAIELQQAPRLHRIIHQADFIAGRLSGQFDVSDENNALKTGYDPVARCWPAWLSDAGVDMTRLPQVVAAGTLTATKVSRQARALGLSADTSVVAGTTDGCAAFLATGAGAPGDGVTSLGTTLVLKLMSAQPLFAPQYGLYSHRIGDAWLAGGASNSGGATLLKFFTPERMRELEPQLVPDQPTGLDYYPLPGRGERFPVNDPALAPRLTPRPADDAVFLQGMLEGIAGVEALGYSRLAALGGLPLTRLRTTGGGAGNVAFTRIRARLLGVPMEQAASQEAAVGTARLAWYGLRGRW